MSKSRERNYDRWEKLGRIGYLSVIYLRKCMDENPEETLKKLDEAVTENLKKHKHFDKHDEVMACTDMTSLKEGSYRFGFIAFDKRKRDEEEKAKREQAKKDAEEQARQKELEEVRRKVAQFKAKHGKVVVKVKR